MTDPEAWQKELRTGILNAVAHELNTPLTPIRLQLYLLQKRIDHLDPETREAVTIIARNTERLHGLIRDVLAVSQFEGGRFPVRPQRTDLAALVNEVCEEYQEPAAEAGVVLQAHSPEQLALEGDPERLRQVLHHLVRNALRHTPSEGRITVSVASAGHWAEVRVRDTGVGFRPEMKESFFEPFVQDQAAQQDLHEGSGLGLYVSQGIIQLHGGFMWAHSDGPGKGAVFGFRVPILAWDEAVGADFLKGQEGSFNDRIRRLL